MLAGKNPAVLLLPTCTLTYIRWNRVRGPATATETHYPEELFAGNDERPSLPTALYPPFHRFPLVRR